MPRTRPAALWALTGALLVLAASTVEAADLISVTLDGAPRASGSSFTDLIDDALSQDGAFQGLSGLANYTLAFDYLGVPNAIVFAAASNGAQVTVSVPSIGFTRVFVGANPEVVEEQIEDFFKNEGLGTYSRFLEEMNARSKIAVLDGNPRSTTALMARGAFDRFGLGARNTRAGYRRGLVAKWGALDLQAELNGGVIESGSFEGLSTVDGALTLGKNYAGGVGFSLSLVTQYRDYDGSGVYDVGAEIGVPLMIMAPDAGLPIRWLVTPFIQSAIGVSMDLAAGGLMMGGGAVNSVSYNVGNLEWMMANELAYYGGIPVDEVGGYSLDTQLDQLIMRNGLKATYHYAELGFVEGGFSVTNFLLSEAAVEVYATPFLGVGIEIGRTALRIGWESDLADDYEAHIGKGEVSFTF